MKLNYINSISFKSKFQLDANQEMPTRSDCILRDGVIGFWVSRAKNVEELHQQLKHFYRAGKEIKEKPYNIVFDIPDDCDLNFEESLKMCGQKYNKIV